MGDRDAVLTRCELVEGVDSDVTADRWESVCSEAVDGYAARRGSCLAYDREQAYVVGRTGLLFTGEN